MRSLSVLTLVLSSLLLPTTTGCNTEPPRCPVINNDYMLTYHYLDGSACDIGPYLITVDGGGSGVKNTTDNRNDVIIDTEVHLRGCSLSLQVDVTNTKTALAMSSVAGNLTVYNVSNISGIGNGAKFSADGQVECQGEFEMILEPPPMSTSTMPIAGMQAPSL